MADTFFRKCPCCNSTTMVLAAVKNPKRARLSARKFEAVPAGGKGTMEYCTTCSFVVNYVKFSCGHCNPDVFAICPTRGCSSPGSPTKQLCVKS